jgi:hypothetical protein
MNRADWAWLMAAVLFGLFFASLAILPEISNGAPRQVTKFNYTTGSWEESVKPAYTRRLTIETNGDIQKMMQAAYEIDPDSFILPSADHPKLRGYDYFQIFFGGVFGMVMVSYLFRIVVKICQRILGVPPLTDEIVRDPSTGSG